MAIKLGSLLLESNMVSEEQLRQALTLQQKEGGRLGTNLVKLGFITEDRLTEFLAKQYKVPAINLYEYKIDPSVIRLIPADMAKKYLIMPVALEGKKLTIVMVDPSNVFAIDDVRFKTGYNATTVVATETAIMAAINHYYHGKPMPAMTEHPINAESSIESVEKKVMGLEEQSNSVQGNRCSMCKNNNLLEAVYCAQCGNPLHVKDSVAHSKDSNIDAEDSDGDTSLMVAARLGNLDDAKRLLDQGANINLVNKRGNSALMVALLYGKSYVARFLLEKGAEVDIYNNAFQTPLGLARDKMKELLPLIEDKLPPSVRDAPKYDAHRYLLLTACLEGAINRAYHFILNPCKFGLDDDDYRYGTFLALKNKHYEIADLFIKNKHSLSYATLRVSVEQNDANYIDLHITNCCGDSYLPIMHHNDIEFNTSWWETVNAYEELRTFYGNMGDEFKKERDEMRDKMIMAGIDIIDKLKLSPGGSNVIDIALEQGNYELANKLADALIRKPVVTSDGKILDGEIWSNTCELALQKGQNELASRIVPLCIPTKQLLEVSIRSGNPDVANRLISLMIKQSPVKKDALDSILEVALKTRRYELAKKLMSSGAKMTKEGLTYARQADYKDLINAACDDNKEDTLFLSIKANDLAMVRHTIEQGAYIDAIDDDGLTPLLVAIEGKYMDIAKLLIQSGANINAQNKKGLTALMIAEQTKQYDIARILKEKGAQVVLRAVDTDANNETVQKLQKLQEAVERTEDSLINIETNIDTLESKSGRLAESQRSQRIPVQPSYPPPAYTNNGLQCPKCGSPHIEVRRKGFSVGKAIAGVALPVVGWWLGFQGSSDIQYVCMNCGLKGAPR